MAVYGRWLLAAVLAVSSTRLAQAGSTPALHARAETDGVHLRWSYGSPSTPVATLMRLERSSDGSTFAPLVTINKPRRRQTYVDVAPPGTWWYRARVESDTGISAWSSSASATVAGVGSGGGGDPGGGAGGGSTTGVGASSPPLAAGQRECPTGAVDDVLARVNDARSSNGAPALRPNASLAVAARTHTIAMAKSGNLTHDGWTTYIHNAGYGGGLLGENIAYGYQSSSAVTQAWLSSIGHRANIMNAGFRDTGIGCVIDGGGRLWWTEDFGG